MNFFICRFKPLICPVNGIKRLFDKTHFQNQVKKKNNLENAGARGIKKGSARFLFLILFSLLKSLEVFNFA